MRKLLKFGHSMTAITFLGSVVVLWVFHHYLPAPAEALEIYVAERQVMERVAASNDETPTAPLPSRET